MRNWLHRTVLAVLMSISVVTPAVADPPESCGKWERKVFAITDAGGLVENVYCLDAQRAGSRWMRHQAVAQTGWSDTNLVFWSGETKKEGVYYRVSASDGALQWSRDLTSWRQVGMAFAVDWRSFTSLISPAPGVIHGLDKTGAVRRWVHSGWFTGADTWADNGVVVAKLPKTSKLFGQSDDGVVGVDGDTPDGKVVVWLTDYAGPRLRIKVPSGVRPHQFAPFDMGRRYSSSAYAITDTGGLAVLLSTGCDNGNRVWSIDEVTGNGYRMVFAGGYVQQAGTPVEWQCLPPR